MRAKANSPSPAQRQVQAGAKKALCCYQFFTKLGIAAAACSALLIAAKAAQPPVLQSYACQSGLYGQSFTGQPPALVQGDAPITWSLLSAPLGMVADSTTPDIGSAISFDFLVFCAF
jgi:hypothetical protein